ncbi:MAG: glutamate decarboxylase [Gammaproteobacteria bacterium]|nr:glutamate decarboxylase [Gammaproteobacteria bacterium]
MKKNNDFHTQLTLLHELAEEFSQPRPVSHGLSATELKSLLDFSLTDEAADPALLKEAAGFFLKYNPDVSQSAFYKLLYSGVNKPALLGDWVAVLSNANMHTFQMSPVATLMELELIKKWNSLIGFEHGDGVMLTGGSQGNLIAMMLARASKAPGSKKNGLQGKTLVAYVSDQAHYSNLRAANVLGIGEDNLLSVATDQDGCIIPEQLDTAIRQSIDQGHTPFYIGLTSGTTVVGAFDPIGPCAEIARRYGLWLHVDGAWGAPVLFSDKYRHYMDGVERADSFSWDMHKLINVPLTAAGIQVREAGFLKEAIAGGGGDYLFHADENADFNLGERSIQCGRRADALKAWMSWKAAGTLGYADKLDRLQDLKSYCVEQLTAHPDFTLLGPSGYLNILFRYEPRAGLDEAQLRQLTIAICKQLRNTGQAFVDYANFKGRSGIRLILANGEAGKGDIDKLIGNCKTAGESIIKAGLI